MILLKASPRGWFSNLVVDSSTWPNFYVHKKFDAYQNIHVLGIFVYLTCTLPIFSELKKLSIYREISLESWSWAWFFWRPLQEGNFEIFLATLQLHRIPNPIWFCNCKLRYTVWEIWESQLIHIRISANLKQLFVPLPPSLHDQVCEARGVVDFCIGGS